MVSRKLDTLLRALRARADKSGGWVVLAPEEVVAVDGILQALAAQSQSQEAREVPATARLMALPAGVIDLAARRTRGTTLASRPDGGAA